MKPIVAVITTSYPYPPGEQFLEAEVPFWDNAHLAHIYLLPQTTQGKPRPIPKQITLDHALRKRKTIARLLYILAALLSPVFYTEITNLVATNRFTPRRAVSALFATRNTLIGAAQLRHFCERNGPVDLAYCYWNDSMAYACCLVKRRGLIRRVVSRAHGFDVYEERRPDHYMPLKRQLIPCFDRIFLLSEQARDYFITRYGASPAQLTIARLGVALPENQSAVSLPGQLHVLSVSSCVPVKRIDRIIAAIHCLAASNPALSVRWTHIGTGPLFDELQLAASATLGPLRNASFSFLGHQPNSVVRRFYEQHLIDVFVNTSESEGVPVSIMEAMSFGVPAVAPNIGGISSLIHNHNGILINSDSDTVTVSAAILRIVEPTRKVALRRAAKLTIKQDFNAHKNYRRFWDDLREIIKLRNHQTDQTPAQ